MKNQLALIFVTILFISSLPSSGQTANQLFYNEPANKWVEALPLGNGRMGAMVYGGVEHDRIQFNEATLWTGEPHDYSHKGASKHIDKIGR
jgi:alpha-L-fucosidase 2